MAAEITVESDMDDDGKRFGIVFPSMNKVYGRARGCRLAVQQIVRAIFDFRRTTKKGESSGLRH